MESAKTRNIMIQRYTEFFMREMIKSIAVVVIVLNGLVFLVLAQDELDPVRNNLSLPQVGLSILTSLSAVAGAVLKGELKAESSHKDLLLLLHAFINGEFKVFTHEDGRGLGKSYFCGTQAGVRLASSSVYEFAEDTRTGITSMEDSQSMATDSVLWRLALWLDAKGYACLKDWCSIPSSRRSQACIIVESSSRSGATLLQRMILSWFRFNCEHIVRLVVASHPQDCASCLEIPGTAWPGLLSFMPRPYWSDIQLGDETARIKCCDHGGRSFLSQALMDGRMGYTDHRRLAIMLPKEEELEKSCLAKAYCSLDAVERNRLTEMAKFVVEDKEIEEEPRAGTMSWSAVRRAVALVVEIGVALILCWAAQMPPLSASLVGRRLVRSHATGAWGNSSLVIAAGNLAQVCMQSQQLSLWDISTSLTTTTTAAFTLIATLETVLVVTGVVAQYTCWALVLVGALPAVFGASPEARRHLAKACAASSLLSVCFLLCIRKNFSRFFPPRSSLAQASAIFCFYILSQVALWCICVFAMGRLRVVLIVVCCAGFGELMWLAAMWAGAHHPSMDDRTTWQRTAAHVAPYLTDAGAALILAF